MNGRHAVLYIGTVVVGEYTGFEFAFLGTRCMAPFFSASGISLVVNKKLYTHRGCSFRYATPEESKQNYPRLTDDIKENIIETLKKKRGNLKMPEKLGNEFTHIIGTVCKGKYNGTQFSFTQLKNAPLFFNMYNISRVVNGTIASYRGCTFRKASYEEAKPYFDNFTGQLVEDLMMMFQPASHIWAIPVKGKYRGKKFLLSGNKEIQQFFSPPSIYKILNGYNKTHLGFSFALVDPDEDRSQHPDTLTQSIFYEIQDELATCFICTFTEWPFKGTRVGFTSRRIANRCFNMNSVRKVITGKISRYKKCFFEVATYEEAASLSGNLTPDVIDYLS